VEAAVEIVRAVVLMLATLSMGLMAGVFGLYANAIMPGLRRTDDRTFVGAFQAVDRAIINPLFMAVFLAALVGSGGAALLSLSGAERAALPWTAAAFVLYLGVFVSTIVVNVPMNDALKAAGEPDDIDVAAARQQFDEAKWSRWNRLRAVATTTAFACLAWALVEHGAGS
jgi:uncharacterized membrane protein